MIKEVRLDDRLIHGQVAVSWTRALDLDVLLVVNDQIVNDPMRKNALKLGVQQHHSITHLKIRKQSEVLMKE